jgi:hypothetical protein
MRNVWWLLLILISCVSTDKSQGKWYFLPLGTGYLCERITHDNTLKDCQEHFSSRKIDIINAVNIIKVYK